MRPVQARPSQPVDQSVRLILVVFAVFTALGFIDLYIRSEHTTTDFAWTINPPLTAAFLGANYLAGFVLVLLSLRERSWPVVRLGFVTVLVFAVATLVATLMHLGNFHLDASEFSPRFVAYVWMVIYVGVPIAMFVALARQHRIRGDNPSAVVRPHRGLRVALALEGVLLFGVGALLFIAPSSADPWWPWTITPLTARAIASWLIAFGFGAGLTFYENDLVRMRIPGIAYATVGLVQIVTLLLYSEYVEWSETSALVYVVVAASLVVTGGYGVIVERRRRSVG